MAWFVRSLALATQGKFLESRASLDRAIAAEPEMRCLDAYRLWLDLQARDAGAAIADTVCVAVWIRSHAREIRPEFHIDYPRRRILFGFGFHSSKKAAVAYSKETFDLNRLLHDLPRLARTAGSS